MQASYSPVFAVHRTAAAAVQMCRDVAARRSTTNVIVTAVWHVAVAQRHLLTLSRPRVVPWHYGYVTERYNTKWTLMTRSVAFYDLRHWKVMDPSSKKQIN